MVDPISIKGCAEINLYDPTDKWLCTFRSWNFFVPLCSFPHSFLSSYLLSFSHLSLLYLNLAVWLFLCASVQDLGEHSCMGSTFSISIMNGTYPDIINLKTWGNIGKPRSFNNTRLKSLKSEEEDCPSLSIRPMGLFWAQCASFYINSFLLPCSFVLFLSYCSHSAPVQEFTVLSVQEKTCAWVSLFLLTYWMEVGTSSF